MSFRLPLLVLTILCLATFPSWAQTISGQKVLMSPMGYLQPGPNGQVLPEGAPRADYTRAIRNAWVVYPDREGLQGTASPGGPGNGMKLPMMTPYYVVDEKGDYLHLVEYNSNSLRAETGKIDKPLQDFGWAPKNRLLLWSSPLVGGEGIVLKGIVANTFEALKKPMQEIRKGQLKIYSDPSLDPSTLYPDKTLLLFNILFIMKDEGDAYLVSTSAVLTPGRAANRVRGWVRKPSLRLWDNRLVMDLNADKAAVDERKAQGVKCALFFDKKEAVNYGSGNKLNELRSLPYRDVTISDTAELHNGFRKRLPIFNFDQELNVFETGFISDIQTLSGAKIDQASYTALQEVAGKKSDALKKINIVFAIDGSTTTATFKQSIIGAVQSVIDRYANDAEQSNIFSFGGVIYRDYAEANCPKGNLMIEKKALTTDQRGFVKWLNDFTPQNCRDQDRPQAVFAGIDAATRLLSGHKDEYKVLVVLGGGGNRNPDARYSYDALLKNIAREKISLITFQLTNTPNPADISFRRDLRSLTVESAQLVQDAIKRAYPKSAKDMRPVDLLPTGEPNTFQLDMSGSASPLPGYLTYCGESSAFDADKLERSLRNVVDNLVKTNNRTQDAVQNAVAGVRDSASSVNVALLSLFTDNNMRDIFENLQRSEAVQFFIPGYAINRRNGCQYDLYKGEIFMTQNELSQVKNRFQKIYNGASNDPDQARIQVYDVFKENLVTLTSGSSELRYSLTKKSGRELMQMFTGLPCQTDIFKNLASADMIKDRRHYPEEDFRRDNQKMIQMYEQLEGLGDDADRHFEQYGETYYWVPRDYLP